MYKDLIDQLRATESRSKRNLLDRAAAAIERLEAERAWVSIEERWPKLHEEVLICDMTGRPYMSVWSLEKRNGGFCWEGKDGEWYAFSEATHWMPLPMAPVEVHHGE